MRLIQSLLAAQLLSLSVPPHSGEPSTQHFLWSLQHVLFSCADTEMGFHPLSCWEQVGAVAISCYCEQKNFGPNYERASGLGMSPKWA